MIKDAQQKKILAKHLFEDGCFVVSEIVVTNANSISPREVPATDIDILAMRPSKSLGWDVIIGDCKTQKISAINRAFWVKGVMDLYDSSTGYLIIKMDRRSGKGVDIDHKVLANKMNIRIIEESDFEQFDKSIIYPYGSSNSKFDLGYLDEIRQVAKSSERLSNVHDYVFRDFWLEGERISGIRKLLNLIRIHRGEFDPVKYSHRDLITLSCAVFSIALSECVAAIFNQYVHVNSRNSLEEALKPLLWSGWAHYDSLNRVRKLMYRSSNSSNDEGKGELELPEWSEFVNVVRGLLDDPRSAFEVPRILESLLFDFSNKSEVLADYNERRHLNSLKHAMLIYGYFCKATKLPKEFTTEVVNALIERQTAIASFGKQSNVNSDKVMPKLIESSDSETPF